MFDDEKMPEYLNVRDLLRLWDGTKIYYCFDKTNDKHMLIINNKYDSVIRLPFEDDSFVNIVKNCSKINYILFINDLLKYYPDEEAWQPRFPCSEEDDWVFIFFKNKTITYTNELLWGLDENYNHYFEIGDAIYYPSETNIIQDIVPHDAHEIGMDFMFRPLRRDLRKYKKMQAKILK